MAEDEKASGEAGTGEAGRDFIRDIVKADLDAGRVKGVVTRFPAGAERLSAYRPRQVDLSQLRPGAGVRRALPFALRRHQSGQGRAGIYRRHRGRRALARLRLGQASLSRLRLFRAALCLGRGPDPGRQGLRRRPDADRDAREPRHAHRAGQEQPFPRRARWRRTSICSAACAPASSTTAPACCAPRSTWRSGNINLRDPVHVPHSACGASAHRHARGRSIRATTTRTASRTPSNTSRIRSARWNSRITGRSTTGSSTT